MKKSLFFLLVGLATFIAKVFAGEPIRVNESVSLEVLDEAYIVDFKPPYCEERIVTLESEANTESFSKIVYGQDATSIALIFDEHDETIEDLGEIFDYMEDEGIPNIPFINLNLQIPQDAKYSVKIEEIQYIDIQTREISSAPLPYHLNYAYVPCQEFSADEQFKEIQFDINEYSKEQFNELYTISEPYGAMGTQGFTFNMSPFIYLPEQQSVIAIYSARFIISVDAEMSLLEMMDNELSSELMATSGAYIYDNYLGTSPQSTSTTYKGKYLIITTSDSYADALTSYIEHRRNCGYDVLLHVQNGGYPNNPTALRNYIKSMYDNVHTRPQYVLLVGDYTQIPLSYNSNDPTDIYYACLEKATAGQETNFFPEVYLGRWPVANSSEIESIANKVITYEQRHVRPRARLFELYSGTGRLRLTFESNNTSAANKLETINRAQVRNFKGSSSGVDANMMLSEFVGSDVLMMVYNGHGSSIGLGNPYTEINNQSVASIVRTPYFAVGFACNLNHLDTASFGPKWITQGDRTLAFYGSMLSTSSVSDTYFSKQIFTYFKEQTVNIRYSLLMQAAAGKYYNAVKTAPRKQEVKMYQYLGDPTVYIFGSELGTGNPTAYVNKKNDSIDEGRFLSTTEKIISVNIHNIFGQLVKQSTDENVLSLEDVYELSGSLCNGTYIISIVSTEHKYVFKISK